MLELPRPLRYWVLSHLTAHLSFFPEAPTEQREKAECMRSTDLTLETTYRGYRPARILTHYVLGYLRSHPSASSLCPLQVQPRISDRTLVFAELLVSVIAIVPSTLLPIVYYLTPLS